MERGFDNLAGHLTDIKDMVIDQNEWYEEMFYDGVSVGNDSGVWDINDDLPSVSDASDRKKGKGFGVSKKKADLRKSNIKQFDLTKDQILGAGSIKRRGPSVTKTLVVKANQSPSSMKSKPITQVSGSGLPKDLSPLI
jgi:hypothetical protein